MRNAAKPFLRKLSYNEKIRLKTNKFADLDDVPLITSSNPSKQRRIDIIMIVKKNIIIFFIALIKHDFGFYNSIWEWDLLPPIISNNYELLEDKLKEWESKGYVRIFIEKGKRMIEIISVPES